MSSTEISIEMENRGGRDVQGGCSRQGGHAGKGLAAAAAAAGGTFLRGTG